MAHYNFQKDLELSQSSVQKVRGLLEEKNAIDISINDDKNYDIKCSLSGKTLTIETKEDLMYAFTGNVAIEYISRGKPSGISTSKADLWCYVLDRPKGKYIHYNGVYFVTRLKLKKFLRENTFRQVSGGDQQTSRLFLIPLERFVEIFEKRL